VYAIACLAIGNRSDAQTAAFEETDVHASAPAPMEHAGGFVGVAGTSCTNATMVDLIRTAYGVDAEKVTGGPAWLDRDRFE